MKSQYMTGQCAGGRCIVCGALLGDYDTKWFSPTGEVACGIHYLIVNDDDPPTKDWRYHTDG